MEINLALPYGTTPSPPHDARLVFWSCGNEDLLFQPGAPIVIECRAGVHAVGLRWTLARNLFHQPFLTGDAEPFPANRFLIRIPPNGLKPGFYDVRVTLDAGDGKPIPGICTFGYNIAAMAVTPDRPADFAAFWKAGLDQLAQISLAPNAGPPASFKGHEIDAYNLASAAMPGDYDPTGHRCEEVEAFKVDFASVKGLRISGWLAKPRGPGPFPAMLVLPGAGFNARPMPLEHARHGYLSLEIQVHGQEVDRIDSPKIPGYYDHIVFDPPQANYMYGVYLHTVQAVSYLASRKDVDPKRIVAVGSSQGGRLGVVVAGLDRRIAAAVPALAHNANIPYLKWAEASNNAKPLCDGMGSDQPPPLPDTPEGRCDGYYDIMSFAPDIRCPILMNAGLIDPVASPSGVFATYQLLGTGDKRLIPLPGLAHDWSPEFDRIAWRWLDDRLGIPPLRRG